MDIRMVDVNAIEIWTIAKNDATRKRSITKYFFSTQTKTKINFNYTFLFKDFPCRAEAAA